MTTKNYPFIKCLHPRIVVNPYTGQELVTGCGVCKACLMNRANKMSFLCSLEEQDNKFCLFFTLTYAPEFMPEAVGVIDKHRCIKFVSRCDRLHDRGKVVCVDENPEHAERSYLGMMYYKMKLNDCIGYCSVREMQLFIKRLRKYVYKKTSKSFRYYVVSEYGPKTFRPHYHGMLFTNDRQVLQVLGNGVRACWKYGRVDYSLSRGKCSSYVARYVNSTYFIPPFLGNGTSKPFSLHSWFFAQSFYRNKKKEIYENAPAEFVRIGRSLNGKYIDFMPWRSLACTFFPRCKSFDCKTYRELYQSYTILLKVKEAFGKSYENMTTQKMCQNIITLCRDTLLHNKPLKFCQNLSQSAALRDVSQYFLNSLSESEILHPEKNCKDNEPKEFCEERLLHKVYTELNISRHFLDFVCDHHSTFEYHRKLRMIIDYWKSRDYSNLVEMYKQQERLSMEYPSSFADMLPYFYTSIQSLQKPFKPFVLTDILKFEVYKNFSVETDIQFEKSIKHKKLNDANAIFLT